MLLVFGQGPVIDRVSRLRAEEAKTPPGGEDINFWSQTAAHAAATLYHKDTLKNIVILGGKTGGEQYRSEAELIGEYITEQNVPDHVLRLETASRNTIENIVNFLNQEYPHDNPNVRIGILGGHHHIGRVLLLMQVFHIPFVAAFSAEEVMRSVAYETHDVELLAEMERRLDINASSHTSPKRGDQTAYYARQKGLERQSIYDRHKYENIWKRAMLEMPEFWISYLAELEDASRIRRILEAARIEGFGIDLAADTDERLREKLAAVPKADPNVQAWLREDWPVAVKQKLDAYIEKRNYRI